MAAGRDIKGRAVIDIVAEATGLRERVNKSLSKAFKVDVNANFSRPQIQSALTAAAVKGKPLSVKVDASFTRAQIQRALKEATAKPVKIKVDVDIQSRQFSTIIREANAAQREITDFERKEVAKRETVRKNAESRAVAAIAQSRERDRSAARASARELTRLEALDAQVKERINAQLNARIEGQNNAFRQRQFFAAQRERARLERLSSKPILQTILVNTDKLNSSLGEFDKTVTRVLRSSLTAFSVWSVGVTALVGAAATAGVVAFSRLEISAARAGAVVASDKFNEAMLRNGKGITNFADVAESAQKRIIQTSQKVALNTLFNPTEVTAGVKALLQAGETIDQALRNIGPAAQFAQATETDLGETTKGLAAGLAASGLQATDSGALLDKFAFVAQSALGDAGDYMTAFANRAAAAGKSFGYSNDEVLTLLELLGQTGTLGEEAGTQANIVFRELARGAGRAGAAWKKYGIDANGTINEQLLQIGRLAEATKKKSGRAGVAGLAQELGLTFRSISSILQVLPQATKLGLGGLNKLTEGIAKSSGNIKRQNDVIRKTIAFQWDNLIDTIRVGFSTFGQAASKEVLGLFDAFAGSDGLIAQAKPKIVEFGQAFGQLIGRITTFVESPAFIRGTKTLVRAIEVTLRGVSDAFVAFTQAFSNGDKAKTAFEAVADAILGFATAAATTLPVVARIIGEIINFLIDHKDSFESFAKLALGVYAVRKAYGLLVKPAGEAYLAIIKSRDALVAWSAAETIGPVKSAMAQIAQGFGLVKLEADGAKDAINGLTAAQAGVAAGKAKGLTGLIGGEAAAGAATGEAAAGGAGASAGALAGPIAAAAAIIAVALELATGAVKGFREEWQRLSKTSNFDEFKTGFGLITGLLHALGDAFKFLGHVLQGQGANIGRGVADIVFSLVAGLGYAIKFVKASVAPIVSAFRAIVRGIGNAIASLERGLANAVSKLAGLPVGGAFQGMAKNLNNAADAADNWGTVTANAAIRVHRALGFIGPRPLQGPLIGNKHAIIALQSGRGAGNAFGTPVPLGTDPPPGSGSSAQFVDPDEAIKAAIDRLKPATRIAETEAAVAKAMSATSEAHSKTKKSIFEVGEGYNATRQQVALFQAALPGLDKAVKSQTDQVSALDQALQGLRNTQLLGSKAFSDQLFAIDQQSKALQLQKLDLQIGGAGEGDPALKALDDQISKLQQQSERTSLVESLQLDPLRRKLDETFNPTTEASFKSIVDQFAQLTKQRAAANAELTKTTAIQTAVSAAAEAGAAKFDKIDAAAQKAFDAIQSGATGASASVSDATTAVQDFSGAVQAVPHAGGIADKSLGQLKGRVGLLAPQFQEVGRVIVAHFSSGLAQGQVVTMRPTLAHIAIDVGAYLRQPIVPATSAGMAVMGGFLTGLKEGFGTPEAVGSIAWYLNVFIPDWIRKNKGPVAYDATILVPAGHAVMEGFGKGLRDGFSQVAGFVKEVGPSLGEFISDKAFSGRTATVMADIAIGKKPDIEGLFGDLRPQDVNFGAFTGALDPTLGFLHRSASAADTANMAQQLAALYHLSITSLTGGKHVAGSLHPQGLAADFSNGITTPQEDSLYAAMRPLLGSVFQEELYRTMIGGNHFNHVHLGWLKAAGFSKDSGKIGSSGFDIPGIGGPVEQAINSAASKYSIAPQLLAAIAKQESGFNPKAMSGDGGYGLFQLTSQGLVDKARSKGNIFDPFVNADVGAGYFKSLLDMFHGNSFKALMGYNGGPGAAANPFAQVVNYANSVLSIFKSFGGFREHGGSVQAGKAYVVGEKRPEMFVPSTNGTILPSVPGTMGAGMTYQDNSVTHVTTAATDPEAVAAYIAARRRRKFAGMNTR